MSAGPRGIEPGRQPLDAARSAYGQYIARTPKR
jgi:hypothetical protein